MKKTAIVGSQWGDEGKGKVVNYFAKDYEWVVRFSGGANAGHTIYINDKKYVNHVLPSTSPDTEVKCFLGAGMVIDPQQLVEELENLEKDFPSFSERIYIDREAFLVLPWHKIQDGIIEGWRDNKIGTTKKGIGPAYTDKVSREGIKFYHLFDMEMLKERLSSCYKIKKRMFGSEIDLDDKQVFEFLMEQLEKMKKLNITFTSALELSTVFRGTSVLFEGAQGVLLDLDFGTYPYVTSGSCMAHGVSTVGFSTFELNEVTGVLKAYTTRVGEGPFPSEEKSETGNQIRERGGEFGATTGRPRRTGWLDIPALKYAKIRSGLTNFIITKADVLNGLDEIKVCVGYDVKGKIKEIPSSSYDFFVAKPVYESLKGWKSTEDINFLKYMAFIEEKTEIQISHISFGPKTDQMITKNDLIKNL